MHQFINGSLTAFTALFEQCRSAGVVFVNQSMPEGCTPASARIAFEGNDQGGVTLLVDRSVSYSGTNLAMLEWIGTGKKPFATPEEMHSWCHNQLREAFGADRAANAVPQVHTPASTDMSEVRRHLAQRREGRALILPSALATALKDVVMGQDQAIEAIAARVASHVNRVCPRRPATLFLVGTTGTGKTRSAEKIAGQLEKLGDKGTRFLRLDMNEYQESHRVSQLLGSPQGYVGYGDGAQLTKQLAQHPRSIVLFDEIEKAHPSILMALMNAMDAGRLTSPTAFNGTNEIDCRQAIFIFTSNLDATGILSDLQSTDIQSHDQINAICRDRMVGSGIRPELAARISTYAVFKPLTEENRLLVLLSSIQDIAQEYGVAVRNVDPALVAHLMATGNTKFGARADEYLIDGLLGLCFAQAAADGLVNIDIEGNPPVAVDSNSTPDLKDKPPVVPQKENSSC